MPTPITTPQEPNTTNTEHDSEFVINPSDYNKEVFITVNVISVKPTTQKHTVTLYGGVNSPEHLVLPPKDRLLAKDLNKKAQDLLSKELMVVSEIVKTDPQGMVLNSGNEMANEIEVTLQYILKADESTLVDEEITGVFPKMPVEEFSTSFKFK